MSTPLITNGERLNQMMQDQVVRKMFENSLEKNGRLSKPPVLTLEINSKDGSEYELEEEDIREVFARFGTVEKVVIRSNGKALIVFSQAINAAFAQNSLNNHEIEDIEVRLKVNWCPAQEIPTELYDINKNESNNKNEATNKYEADNKNETNYKNKELTNFRSNEQIEEKLFKSENFNAMHSDFGENGVKYTCRFDIQIENEREFQVCRKIIGPKGSNMKQIIEFCCQDKHEDYSFIQEQIKLRLRGKGSGYKEGINKIESEDNLHLCVSSLYFDMYIKACSLIERLLFNLYDEYKLFCLRNGRPFDPNLTIKKHETTIRGGGKFYNEKQYNFAQPSSQHSIYYPTYYPHKTNTYPVDYSYENNNYYKPNNVNFYNDINNNNDNNLNNGNIMEITEDTITRLIEARNKARKELNFKEADRIRNYLKSKGVALMDEKGARGKGIEVTTWKFIKNNYEGEIGGFVNTSMTPAFG